VSSCILFPTTCRAMNVCELTLVVLLSPKSRTGTTRWGAWRMSRWVRERSRPSSPSQLWLLDRCLLWYNYLIILYRIMLYINDVIFVSVPWVIICVRLDPSSTHLAFRVRVWCPLKPGCDTPPYSLSSFWPKRRMPHSLQYTVVATPQTQLVWSRKTLIPLSTITTTRVWT
jgi:hypothetical protein